jgi:hypothetical protein
VLGAIDDADLNVEPEPEPEPIATQVAPWRKHVGAVWMGLDSEYGALWGERASEKAQAVRCEIVGKMYEAFADPAEWETRLVAWTDKVEDGLAEPVKPLGEYEVQVDTHADGAARGRNGIMVDSDADAT